MTIIMLRMTIIMLMIMIAPMIHINLASFGSDGAGRDKAESNFFRSYPANHGPPESRLRNIRIVRIDSSVTMMITLR